MLGGIDNALFLKSLSGFAVMGVLMLLLRWAFSRGKSVAQRPSQVGDENSYGMLRVVAKPTNFIEGELIRRKLLENGIKANLTQTKDGPRVFVFADEVKGAEAILRG